VDVVYLQSLRNVPFDSLSHGIVDTSCAETSAERKHSKIVIEAEFFSCLRLAEGCVNGASHGKSGNAVFKLALIHEIERLDDREHNVVNFL